MGSEQKYVQNVSIGDGADEFLERDRWGAPGKKRFGLRDVENQRWRHRDSVI
jgi:hypothetical protein